MKRTPIPYREQDYPEALRPLLAGVPLYDSSCSPEARVIMIDRDGGYFLKSAARGSLAREAAMDAYFHAKGLSSRVVSYLSSDRDWLLTERVAGEDCTHADYLAEPARLCDLLAERLRALHETDAQDCPVQTRMTDYFALAEENYRKGCFDPSYLLPSYRGLTADAAWQLLEEGRGRLQNEVLLHGDYCLPNVILDRWHFSGFIDLGNGGVGDRHVDLFWGAWTLHFNLGTDRYRDRFFDAYGRDRVDEELIALISVAEAFG